MSKRPTPRTIRYLPCRASTMDPESSSWRFSLSRLLSQEFRLLFVFCRRRTRTFVGQRTRRSVGQSGGVCKGAKHQSDRSRRRRRRRRGRGKSLARKTSRARERLALILLLSIHPPSFPSFLAFGIVDRPPPKSAF